MDCKGGQWKGREGNMRIEKRGMKVEGKEKEGKEAGWKKKEGARRPGAVQAWNPRRRALEPWSRAALGLWSPGELEPGPRSSAAPRQRQAGPEKPLCAQF